MWDPALVIKTWSLNIVGPSSDIAVQVVHILEIMCHPQELQYEAHFFLKKHEGP